jgi:hypothetical protein
MHFEPVTEDNKHAKWNHVRSTFEVLPCRATSASYRGIDRGQQPGKKWQREQWTTVRGGPTRTQEYASFFLSRNGNMFPMSMDDKNACTLQWHQIDQQKRPFYQQETLKNSEIPKQCINNQIQVCSCAVMLRETSNPTSNCWKTVKHTCERAHKCHSIPLETKIAYYLKYTLILFFWRLECIRFFSRISKPTFYQQETLKNSEIPKQCINNQIQVCSCAVMLRAQAKVKGN